jgi:hypothetical protein
MTDMRSLRTMALAALALLLGGCNLVVSETPVFSTADAAGAPSLRPGIWAAPQPDCDFKTSDPLDKWPKCAGGAAITPDAILAAADSAGVTPDQSAPAPAKTLRVPYVLAAGDPRIMQIHFVLPLDPAIKAAFYYFIALKPIAHDADGRITDAEVWLVQCGPPPPPNANASDGKANQGGITDHPLPGMTVTKGECNPTDKAAVINAALPSRAWAGDQLGTLHWIRDGLK